MAMISTLLTLLLLALASELIYDAAGAPARPKAAVIPLAKDPKTSQYITHIKQRTPLVDVQLVLDLGGEFLWMDCESGYVSSSFTPALCHEPVCSHLIGSSICSTCFGPPKPGCHNNTCGLLPYNPFITTSTSSDVGQDRFLLHSTDGAGFGPFVSVPKLVFSCAPTSLLEGLATHSKGVAGLGRGNIGLPARLALTLGLAKKFAVCFGTKGFVIFGDSPYHLVPRSNVDFSKYLTYTPLIVNPVSTAGAYIKGKKSTDYFINVTAIHVNKIPLNISPTLLTIDSAGTGGTKLSTAAQYTVLETSIYKALIDQFRKAAGPVKAVAPVAPFGLCYNTKSFQDTYLGPAVPQIDLILHEGGVKWFIYGANSMVHVSRSVMCLGFVDGGVKPRTSVVVGRYQLDQYLLQFDLVKSRLGFSISMRSSRTSCSNFNFTVSDT